MTDIVPLWLSPSHPWLPTEPGEVFEARLRSTGDWIRMRWHGWSVNYPKCLAEPLDGNPHAYDIIDGARPLPWVAAQPDAEPAALLLPHRFR